MKARGGLIAGVVGLALVTAGLAAAERCHMPLPGTHSLTIRADVTGYRFSGGHVVVDWARSSACGGTAVWDYAAAAQTTTRLACEGTAGRLAAGAGTKLVASDATRIVRVVPAPALADMPARLVVLDRATSRRLASWPLPELPARVALYHGVAILSGASRDGLFALRLSDGRIVQLGIARAGDRPLIGPAGVLYQDDLDLAMHRTAPAERTLKLVPLATVDQELTRPATTVRYIGGGLPRPYVGDPITAMAMDGPRVALAVHDPAGRCDYVLFWNVEWHYISRLTRASGPTCLPTHAAGGITGVAIAGSRAAWTVTYGGKTRLLAAVISDCQEWTVARPAAGAERVVGLAGDGGTLAYALAPARTALSTRRSAVSSVGIVGRFWRGAPIEQLRGNALALSVDGGEIAALGARGTVSVTTRTGQLVRRLAVTPAHAVALRRNTIATLSDRGTLDVYSVTSGRQLHSWPMPSGATSVDLQYGIALVTAGHDVYAVNATTGRRAHLFSAPGKVSAQIEEPGAAIEFDAAGRGHLAFVPMSQIEASTR